MLSARGHGGTTDPTGTILIFEHGEEPPSCERSVDADLPSVSVYDWFHAVESGSLPIVSDGENARTVFGSPVLHDFEANGQIVEPAGGIWSRRVFTSVSTTRASRMPAVSVVSCPHELA